MENRIAVLKSFGRFMWAEFGEQRLNDSAKALTYTSLFAVVPLMTVMFAVLSAAPMFESSGDQLQTMLFDNLMPSTGGEVLSYITKFADQAKNLTAAGAVMLFVTSFLMLKSIEAAFNRIWHVNEARQGLRSFLLYWAVLSLGPVLLGVALAMRTYIISLNLISNEGEMMSWISPIFTLVPWLLTALAFILLFYAVPNCQVKLRHAVAGGLIAAIVFHGVKWLFSLMVEKSSYYLVYGAFAAAPLFLLWVYISWLLILFGAQLVKGFSYFSFSRHGEAVSTLWLKLLLLELFWTYYQKGDVVTDDDVFTYFDELTISNMTVSRWQDLKEDFLIDNLMVLTDSGDTVLCRDLESLSLWELVVAENEGFMREQSLPQCLAEKSWCRNVNESLQRVSVHSQLELQASLSSAFMAE